MKASHEYEYELRVHQESLRQQPREPEQLREMVTHEAARLGMSLKHFFQPVTFAQTLHNMRSALLEAIALVCEERMNENQRRQTRNRPSA